jgi:OCT family organic cation transporter-like MFS transporter 4/5
MLNNSNKLNSSLNESNLLSNDEDNKLMKKQQENINIRKKKSFLSTQSIANATTNPYDKCSFYLPYSQMASLSLNNLKQTNINLIEKIELKETDQKNESEKLLNDSDEIVNLEEFKNDSFMRPDSPKSRGDDSILTQFQNDEKKLNRIIPDNSFDESKKSKTTSARSTRSNVPYHVRKSFCDVKGTNLDHVLALTGSFGFYQKIKFLLVGFLAIIPSMVAYSYVFVSATPQFSCKIVREIQLISTNGSTNLFKLNEENVDQDEIDSDDPFKHLNWDMHEFLIETRRFIHLIPENTPKNKVKFDNNCNFDSDKVLEILSKTNSKAKHIQDEIRKNVSSIKFNDYSRYGTTSTTTRSLNLKRQAQSTLSANRKILKSNFKCVEWIYKESLYGSTTVTDWDLVCLKSHLKAVTQNAFILGTGCSVFTGILSDKLGRRTALLLMITLMVFVLNITQFLMHSAVLDAEEKFIIFTFSRFLQGVAQTMYSISFVLLLELTGPKDRVTAGNILAYSFSIGQMLIVGLAYYFKNWLKVQWALAIYVIPFLSYYWMMPESPRWLLSSDKVNEARRVLIKVTRYNSAYEKFVDRFLNIFCRCWKNRNNFIHKRTKIDVEHDDTWDYILSLLRTEANTLVEAKKNTSYMQTLVGIIKSPILLRRCLILLYTWMVILAVYLGIGMGISGNLDKIMNPYLVFLIAAIFEFISIVTCHLTLNRFGRKHPLVVFMLITSISVYLIPIYYESHPNLSILFYFLAKYSIGAAQLTCMIFTSELYPTPMRSTGVGLSVALARLGGVWAPQINVLSSTLGSIYIPFIIFSVSSFLAAILCILLPETLNKQLPETISQAKALNNKN